MLEELLSKEHSSEGGEVMAKECFVTEKKRTKWLNSEKKESSMKRNLSVARKL